MDKRKGIILAIVLFLIIGLGTFVFAGGSEDEGSGNGTITPQPDGGDDKILLIHQILLRKMMEI